MFEGVGMKDLTAIVTGAGRGIGRAIATALGQEGVKVVLFGGRDLQKLEETAELVRVAGGKAIIKAGELTDENFLSSGVEQVVAETGGVDILINNAGIATNALVEETSAEMFDKIMNINVRAPYLLTQKALPYLKKSKRASIINIASVVAHAGYHSQSAYAASKHALLGFTKCLASEVYKEGVRVHAISPGGVYTDMIKITRPDLTSDGMIVPEDIADIVMFLLKNRGNAVVDEIIVHRLTKEPFLV